MQFGNEAGAARQADGGEQRKGGEEGEARRAPEQAAVVGEIAAVRALVEEADD
jgi:hypothetical protein